jgi:hypothetical protein
VNRSLLAGVLLALALAAGCGGEPPSRQAASSAGPIAVGVTPTPTPGREACAVFTQAEVQTVMGVAIDPGQLSSSGGAQRCIWWVTGKAANFQLGVARGPGGYARQVYGIVGIPEAKAYPGLGDQAKLGLSRKCCTQGFVAVVKGQTELDISITGAASDPTEETLRDLAQKALSRL